MSKTTSRGRPAPSTNKGGSQRKSRKAQPKRWYQGVGMTTWIVAGLVAALVMFALLSRGNDGPQRARALPAVGADLHSFVVDPADPERLFIGSHQGVSVSTDGGDSWEVVDSLDGADAMGWAFTDGAVFVGGHPGLYISTDGNATFEQRTEGLPNTDVHALGAGGGVIYGASPGAGLFASTDGGETWTVRNGEVGRGFMGRILVDPDDPDHVIAPDMELGAAESTDGGKTWDALGGVQGAMWVTWDASDTDDIIVSATGSAQRSTDGGDTWTSVEIPAGASIVEFSPADPKTLYAAVHENPVARIWTSTDDGETWKQI